MASINVTYFIIIIIMSLLIDKMFFLSKLLNDEKKSLNTSKEINHSTLESQESNPSNKKSKNPITENETNLSTTELTKQNNLTTSDSQLYDRKDNSNEYKASEKPDKRKDLIENQTKN